MKKVMRLFRGESGEMTPEVAMKGLCDQSLVRLENRIEKMLSDKSSFVADDEKEYLEAIHNEIIIEGGNRNLWDVMGYEYTPDDDDWNHLLDTIHAGDIDNIDLAMIYRVINTKDEILSMYLNTIYFGHACYGIAGAAEYYFGKSADRLSPAEGATLAAVIRSPNNYSPFVNPEVCLRARNNVLRRMRDLGKLSALCGCVIASTGSACGLVYLRGGSYEAVCSAIKNMIGNITGMVCDGAKVGCAMKVASGVASAIQSAVLAMDGTCISENDGIIEKDIEKTIRNLGQIGSVGMQSADNMILDIMVCK